MKCVICHSEDIEVKEIREEFAINNDIVYVFITVPVCGSCGERYYNRRTMKLLEETKANLSHKRIELKQIGRVFTTTSRNGFMVDQTDQ